MAKCSVSVTINFRFYKHFFFPSRLVRQKGITGVNKPRGRSGGALTDGGEHLGKSDITRRRSGSGRQWQIHSFRHVNQKAQGIQSAISLKSPEMPSGLACSLKVLPSFFQFLFQFYRLDGLAAVSLDIEQFNHHRKCHCKVYVAFWHMYIKPFSHQGETNQHQE